MSWLDGVTAPDAICPPLCSLWDFLVASMILVVVLYGLLEEELAEWIKILRER